MKKYQILLIILICINSFSLGENYIFDENRSYLFSKGDVNYFINDTHLDLFYHSTGAQIFDIDAYNIINSFDGYRIYTPLQSHLIDNSIIKFVNSGDYQSYIFSLNKSYLSVFTNFYTKKLIGNEGDNYWEGKNYYLKLKYGSHLLDFFVSKNNLLPEYPENSNLFSFSKYKYSKEKFGINLKFESLENYENDENYYLINSKIRYKSSTVGFKTLFEKDEWLIFLDHDINYNNINLRITPFYRENIFDLEFDIDFKEFLYIKKNSRYDWIFNNQNNYYEAGIKYNNIFNLYARYVERNKFIGFTDVENKYYYGLQYDYTFNLYKFLKINIQGDLINGNNYSSYMKSKILFDKSFFKNDLNIVSYLEYNNMLESEFLDKEHYFNFYIRARLKGGRFYIKVKNLFDDKLEYLNGVKENREVIFGVGLFLYN